MRENRGHIFQTKHNSDFISSGVSKRLTCTKIMVNESKVVTESDLTFSVTAGYGSASIRNKGKLKTVVKPAAKNSRNECALCA